MTDERFTAGGEDWEEQIVEHLVKMFKDMGMDIDANLMKQMMEQIKEQLDGMDIDPEKLADGKVELNLQGTINDLAKIMGANFPTIPQPVDVATPKEATEGEEEVTEIPEADLFVDGESMSLTIDCSRVSDIPENGDGVELTLVQDGNCLSVFVEGRPHPVKRYNLTQTADSVAEWALNNGILDVTLTLKK
jgi:hypothetical protein